MRRALAVLVMIAGVSATVFAGTLDVGLVASQELSRSAHDIIGILLDLLPPSGQLEEYERLGGIRDSRRELDREYHESLAGEREMAESKAADENEPYWQCDEPYRIIDLEAEEQFVSGHDESMLTYLTNANSLDILFAFWGEDDGQIASIDVYYYADGKVQDIFSTLYLSGESVEGRILSALVGSFSDGLVVLDVSAFPSSGFLDAATGDEITSSGGYAIVDSSVTDIIVHRDGYHDLEIPVQVEDGLAVISGNQEEEDIGLFTLVVNPADADASLFGVLVSSLPLVTSFDMGAVLMTLSKDGFRDENLQIGPGQHFQSVMLRPQWMGEDGRVKEAKDEMYRSMRNTILSFALYVVMTTIGDIYPQTATWTGVAGGISAGISIINLIDFLHDCLAYYDSARQTYL